MAGNFDEVGKQFVRYYYEQFDADRRTLGSLYVRIQYFHFHNAHESGLKLGI